MDVSHGEDVLSALIATLMSSDDSTTPVERRTKIQNAVLAFTKFGTLVNDRGLFNSTWAGKPG